MLVRGLIAAQAISTSSILRTGGGFYYGLIPAIVFAAWYVKRTHLPALKVLDAFSPSVAAGLAIARIGCYTAGCCYGKPIRFSSSGIIAYASVQPSAAARLSVPIHPTQLYESAAAFLIFFFLIHQFRRSRNEGQTFGLMLVLLAAGRFVIEFFRGDARGFIIDGVLSVPQFLSGVIILVGMVVLLRLRRLNQRQAQQRIVSS